MFERLVGKREEERAVQSSQSECNHCRKLLAPRDMQIVEQEEGKNNGGKINYDVHCAEGVPEHFLFNWSA